MEVKDHYDTHLGNFYSWTLGDFSTKVDEMYSFFDSHGIHPHRECKPALDLGCGNGIQSVALARLGFEVISVDFNNQLIDELHRNADRHAITIHQMNLMEFDTVVKTPVAVITCMGDTPALLPSTTDLRDLLRKSYTGLEFGGRLILSFRDYASPLLDDKRFIPVKSDESRNLTCFLEYFDEYVSVTDLLHER